MRLPIKTWREVRDAFIHKTPFDLENDHGGLVVITETSPDFRWGYARRVDRFGAGRRLFFHVLEKLPYYFQHGDTVGRIDRAEGETLTCNTCGERFSRVEIETTGYLIPVERLKCRVVG